MLSAFIRAVLLLSSMLFMVVLWTAGRIPGVDFPLVAFTFLSSAFLVDVMPLSKRLLWALAMACGASAVQFSFAILHEMPVIQAVVSAVLAYVVFLISPDHRAGCIVLITGYLTFSAPGGWLQVLNRSAAAGIGVLVIMLVTALGNAGRRGEVGSAMVYLPYSPYQALIMAAELGLGTLLCRMFQLEQGAWIMLTILFISMSETPHSPVKRLVFQRILAVPLGIIGGGFLLESLFRLDYRLFYLVPFIGAVGFFILYNYGDFFLFSIIFMISLTVLSDWLAGPYHRFHFWDSFLSRSAATLLGALLELFMQITRQTDRRDKA